MPLIARPQKITASNSMIFAQFHVEHGPLEQLHILKNLELKKCFEASPEKNPPTASLLGSRQTIVPIGWFKESLEVALRSDLVGVLLEFHGHK
jgi:hypothetical protein